MSEYELEAELLARCRDGDGEAYAQLYERYGRVLYANALRILRNSEAAEDAVQETFVRLVGALPAGKVSRVGPWLRRVNANYCIDRLRRRDTRGRELTEVELPAHRDEPQGTLRSALETAISALPERARQILLLHDVEGFKHSEIAESLAISVGTSKSQLFRARELLRASLGEASR